MDNHFNRFWIIKNISDYSYCRNNRDFAINIRKESGFTKFKGKKIKQFKYICGFLTKPSD